MVTKEKRNNVMYQSRHTDRTKQKNKSPFELKGNKNIFLSSRRKKDISEHELKYFPSSELGGSGVGVGNKRVGDQKELFWPWRTELRFL